MIAFVRGVIAFSTSLGSIHQVSSHTSTITGVAFTSKIVAAVACQVKPGRITSSPIPIPQASKAICNVTVPFAACLLYTSDAADEEDSVDLGGRRIIKK